MTADYSKRVHAERTRRQRLKSPVPVTVAIAFVAPFFATVTFTQPVRASQHGDLLATTANFAVRSYCGGPNAEETAEYCESLRKQVRARWLEEPKAENWRPRCEIVLHASKGSYLQAVGRNAGKTSGSCLIKLQRGRICLRRIDLLVDGNGRATALSHELTHVVLADGFGGQRPPPWLDEGIATLADSETKLARHEGDCVAAVRSGTAFQLVDLLTLDRLSSSAQFPTFYGQSVSLVKFLCDRGEPAQLVPFAKLAMEKGYDDALRSSYDINGVGQLQRMWFEQIASRRREQPFGLAAFDVER